MKAFFSPLIIFLLGTIIYLSTRVPSLTPLNQSKDLADFSFKQVTISMHKDGKKIWTLKAKDSAIFNKTNSIFFEDIDGQLMNMNGTILTFQSPTGAYQMNHQLLKLVKTTSTLTLPNTNYFFICDEIEINSQDHIISAYGNLFINSEILLTSNLACNCFL